jgi:hypothetical protein
MPRGCSCTSQHMCDRCWTLLVRAGGVPPPEVSEGQLQARVREVCKRLCLLHYHTKDSRKSERGFVDSMIIAPTGGVLWAMELKVEGQTPTEDQKRWLHALSRVTRVESGIVRPSSLAAFVKRLQEEGA